jgi:hypothetical protein
MNLKPRLARYNLVYYPKVWAKQAESQQFLGNMVDINIKGLKLISSNPIPDNSDLLLRLEISLELGGMKNLILDIAARSVWCRRDINEDFFDTGFVFEDISSDYVIILEKFIKEFRFSTME